MNKVDQCIQACQSAELLEFDESGWFFISKFLAWNPVQNRNQWVNVKKLFDTIPTSLKFYEDFQSAFLNYTTKFSKGLANGFETLSEPFQNQEQKQEQEQDQEQKQGQKQKQKPDPEHTPKLVEETLIPLQPANASAEQCRVALKKWVKTHKANE